MKGLGVVSGALAAASLLASAVSAQSWSTIPALQIKGQHFFYSSNGSEFQIMGVAYQQGYDGNSTDSTTQYVDPLADPALCQRDIPQLVALRTNTIRVYAIDPTANHDDCMAMLASAGIYVVADLGEPNQSINRDDPTWTVPLYQRYISVVDALEKYNNVMGFFAGNEVSNSFNTTEASAYVKAAVRDTKAYIKNQGYRTIGVGYATYDGPIRDQLAQYFNCGDPASAIDFWGYNVYSWCGDSTFQESGYQDRVEFFQDYSVPVFFAEYGCNDVEPRPFTEVGTIFGSQMTPTWSGGIVYMYFQETNNYGLVSVSGNSVSRRQDFSNLSSQMAKVTATWTATNTGNYNPKLTPTACPTLDASWMATATPLPPSPNGAVCACEDQTLSCHATSDDATLYGSSFNFICGNTPKACQGIVHNGTTGQFGAISMCSPKDQLSWVMNQYYLANNRNPSACAFSGLAATQAAASASGTCQSLVQAAGSNGMGTVPSPTGNAAAQGAGTSDSAASGLTAPSLDFAMLGMGIYVLAAAGVGASMMLL